jgi:DNA invertase Pin-like site-specific DNA recombinase
MMGSELDALPRAATYGYARVSTTDQDVAFQVAKLKEAGCEIIRQEKATGTSRDGGRLSDGPARG